MNIAYFKEEIEGQLATIGYGDYSTGYREACQFFVELLDSISLDTPVAQPTEMVRDYANRLKIFAQATGKDAIGEFNGTAIGSAPDSRITDVIIIWELRMKGGR